MSFQATLLTVILSGLLASRLLGAEQSSPSIEVTEQGLEAGQFGNLTLRNLPSSSDWSLSMVAAGGQSQWRKIMPRDKGASTNNTVNHLVPFLIPAAGEYEIRLENKEKWIIRLYLLSENNQLWIGESLHEAVLNMLGVMKTKSWYGSPSTNLPIDDPKFIAWVTSREQNLLREISQAQKPDKKSSKR